MHLSRVLPLLAAGALAVGSPSVAFAAGGAGSPAARGSGAVVRTTATVVPDAVISSRRTVPLTASSTPATQRPAATATAGTSCATGGWVFVDQAGTTRGAYQSVVQVIRSSDNAVLGSGYALGSGSYNVCWSTGGTATSVYVHFVEGNNVWGVTNNAGTTYAYSTGVSSVPDGTTQSFGTVQPSNSAEHRALHAYVEAAEMYDWIYQSVSFGGGCWSPYDSTCQHLAIHWQSDATSTSASAASVYLSAAAPDSQDVATDEYAHVLMYDLYGQTYPTTTNCSSHTLFGASSTTCAWTEGWAEWAATSIYSSMIWTYADGSTQNLDVTWNEGLGYATGDQVEGRVVQALHSLTDGVKAPFDNDPGEGTGTRDASKFLPVLHSYHPTTFADFWSGRASAGQDVSQTALSALYQGTIDYGFRNPLTSLVAKHLPEAVPAHAYSDTTTTGYWSVVAVKPDVGSDVDLTLFNDSGLGSSLGSSAYGGSVADFVGINSNSGHRALQTYYPRVNQFAGTGGYAIEAAQGSSTLSAGTQSVSYAAGQIVSIRDSYQVAGTPVYYRAVPTDAFTDVQLASLPADQDIAPRNGATISPDNGLGTATLLSVTPSVSGYAGLVLLDNSETAGTVTLYADQTAPTGTLAIDGGAVSTTDPSLALTTTASDGETGMLGMQISTDGTFDTEPVVPYASSATLALHGASGRRTVSVRYENNAGQFSDPVSATINLKARPVVTSISPASGSTAGGGNVVITGDFLNGTTGVSFGTAPAASFAVSNPTRVVAVPSAADAGKVNLHVTTAQGSSVASTASAYTFVAQPVVTAVSPAAGTLGGGSTVTVTGTGFAGATSVKFGSTVATSYTVVSRTVIHAVVPAHAAGTVDVRVTVPDGGTSAVATGDRYAYQDVPTVTSVNPVSGPAAGGTRVTITGTNLTGATVVRFGGASGTAITVLNATKLTVTAPAGAAGTIDVVVTTPGGTSALATGDAYTYIPAPAVSGLAPKVGPAAGGTTVTITGTNLSGATTVTFGSTVATDLVVLSDTKVRATSPAGSGVQAVHVTTAGGTSAEVNADRFTYQ